MHRLSNEGSVLRFRVAAALLLVKWLLVPASLASLLYTILLDHRELILVSLGVIGLTVVVAILQWLVSARCRCPLCIGLPLCRTATVKNRNAQRLLGSHRLRVAHNIFLKGYFRCPYCNEPTAMEVRDRHHRRNGHH
ncbi:MAG: hypothetical protein J0M04_23195 [Verrucomicrobia bacterium]|nr:hypothetical protein [Verrucomicrobiota bacterium]